MFYTWPPGLGDPLCDFWSGLEMTTKQDKIRKLIEGQKEFMNDVNAHGYSEKDYWLNNEEYRRTQENLAKEIHNDAHSEYINEYQSKSVLADITSPGGWLEDELIQINEELNKWYPSKKDS